MTLIAAARSVLEDAWDDERGYCFPHRNVYPHLWLWDSCFHAIAWAALGDERAVRELEAVFVGQLDDGFVPHMRYAEPTIDRGPLEHASSFTQPPVFAHAAAELSRRGLTVPEHLMAAATAGLEWLWRHRMGDDGLLYVVHPWESGADDSPRWDDWVGGSEWNRSEWTEADMRWRDAVTYHPSGAAAWSTEFVAAPAAFNAIAAHGAAELAGMTGDGDWQRRADALADAIDRELWDEEAGLWSDRAVVGGGPSVARPTLDGALPALVTADEARARSALARLGAPAEFRGEFGLRYVPATDPAYDPAGYWRGSAWMQLHYLCWLAAARWGDEDLLAFLPACSRAAAERAGFAEHWNPDTGEGLGARPQTWSALVVAMAPPQAADVFLSYASEDRDVATDVAAAIERRGWEVFWDTRLVAGEQYRDALAHHLATVGCVVVLWSEHSVASRWVRDEAGRGAERGVLVPARIAEVALPLGFGEAHTADLTRWDGDDGHPEMIELLSGVERTLTGTVAPPPELTHWQRLRRGLTWRKLRERLWRSLGAAAVVFGLLGFGLVQIVDWIRGPPPPRAMQGDVNVAVADFAVAEATDRELAAREGQSLAGSVHAQLVSSLGCDGVRFDCRPPTETGRVDGDAAAEELSNDILADIVVFGTVTEARGRVTFHPPCSTSATATCSAPRSWPGRTRWRRRRAT